MLFTPAVNLCSIYRLDFVCNFFKGTVSTDQGLTKDINTAKFMLRRPIADTQVRLIKITDDPISQIRDNLDVPENQVGEITVKAEG